MIFEIVGPKQMTNLLRVLVKTLEQRLRANSGHRAHIEEAGIHR